MARPRFDDSKLRDAILSIVPGDGWMSQGKLTCGLSAGLLPHGAAGRQRLCRTLNRMEEEWFIIRHERLHGHGRGPFWRRLAGALKFEAVHHALFEGVRERSYSMVHPPIRLGPTGEMYIYGEAVPEELVDSINEALGILSSAGESVLGVRGKLEEALDLLRQADAGEGKARAILMQTVNLLPAKPMAILVVPFVSKIGRGETLWISHTKTKTEAGEVVRKIRRIRRPGRESGVITTRTKGPSSRRTSTAKGLR
jgi:hypothetical protein